MRPYWFVALLFLVLAILPFQSWSPVAGFWGLALISFFLFAATLIIAYFLKDRDKKKQRLVSGEDLLFSWTMTPEMKRAYVVNLYKQELGKNQIILFSISFVAIIVFGLFIIFVDEGKWAMFLVLLGLILFLSVFAFGMPLYYKYKNAKGDGVVLLGKKYVYINGFFHNWDYPLSGIKSVKSINSPFYGIQLSYYYTDRTLRHTYTLLIPVPDQKEIREIISMLKK